MRIALAPINPTVGALRANTRLIIDAVKAHDDADLVVLPELCVSGYPPRDLLLHGWFIESCDDAIDEMADALRDGPPAVIGAPLPHPARPGAATNSLVVVHGGRRIARYDKRLLPTYDVFDEWRYFAPGVGAVVVEIAGERVGLSVCEDLWGGIDAGTESRYAGVPDPIAELADAGATVIVNPSATPFVLDKHDRHRAIVATHATRHRVPVLTVNQFGANDDVIFDGAAFVTNAEGDLIGENERWSGAGVVVDTAATRAAPIAEPPAERRLLQALTLGVRDYAQKSGFTSACLGLSGGIDSAVTAAIAAMALGPDRVIGVAMPSRYSSTHSVEDAHDLAGRIGCRCIDAPIRPPFEGFGETIDSLFASLGEKQLGKTLPDVTEENLQSRVRGTIMMAVSNRTGALLLTTGNKSEIAVGYSTLYGDMNGGLAVISDLLKGEVYAVARYMNDHARELGFDRAPIPASTITKPPSAELAPDQKDEDTLPPYDRLDEIVRRRIEERESPEAIMDATGFDRAEIDRVCRLIAVNEYKRYQLAIGLKVKQVCFGPGRRMPLAAAVDPNAARRG